MQAVSQGPCGLSRKAVVFRGAVRGQRVAAVRVRATATVERASDSKEAEPQQTPAEKPSGYKDAIMMQCEHARWADIAAVCAVGTVTVDLTPYCSCVQLLAGTAARREANGTRRSRESWMILRCATMVIWLGLTVEQRVEGVPCCCAKGAKRRGWHRHEELLLCVFSHC